MRFVQELRGAQFFFLLTWRNLGLILQTSRTLCPCLSVMLPGYCRERFIFISLLLRNVLMQPLLLSHVKILKNEHAEGNRSFLAWLSVSDIALSQAIRNCLCLTVLDVLSWLSIGKHNQQSDGVGDSGSDLVWLTWWYWNCSLLFATRSISRILK